MIKKGCCATSILIFALVNVGNTQAAFAKAESGEPHTQSQLRQLAREAHTPEQYMALAHYYDDQQKNYLKQAAVEKKEWVRRSPITASLYAKYPRPADSSRNLYEYYVEKASEAGALSAKYSHLAEPTDSATQ
ncbi:MAG: hypothetical protein ACLPY1_11575 [Terracidiphilus sp.]